MIIFPSWLSTYLGLAGSLVLGLSLSVLLRSFGFPSFLSLFLGLWVASGIGILMIWRKSK